MINDTEYVCGGKEPITAQCFNLITGKNAPISLLHKRVFASSVTTNVTNFVFGGTDGSGALATYETISVDHAQSEGVLPFTWQKGCSTLINSTTILLAGGIQNETENNKGRTGNTWFFNLRTKESTQGPTMIQDRYWFGCGYISGINSVAVFGGGQPPMATTEIVKLPGGSFKKGIHQRLFDYERF